MTGRRPIRSDSRADPRTRKIAQNWQKENASSASDRGAPLDTA